MTPIAAPWIDSPLEVLPRTRALLVETRHRIAVNRRQLNPWWTLTGGSDAFRNGELRLSSQAACRLTPPPAPPEVEVPRAPAGCHPVSSPVWIT